MNILPTWLATILLLASLLLPPVATATDQDLLDILLKNGVLNKSQHRKLSQKVAKPKPTKSSVADWTKRVKISADLRFRHENLDSNKSGVLASRQRIRARLKIAGKVNDQVDVGFRIATGFSATSGNTDLGDNFADKDIYLDLAYINWQPDFVDGLTASFGKFKQPWYKVSQLSWDNDINPEGIALSYKRRFAGVDFAATGAYLLVADGARANNDSFSDDYNIHHYGVSAAVQAMDDAKISLGSNLFISNNEGEYPLELYEVAGKIDINTPIIPIYFYSQYVANAAAASDADHAWLAGVGGAYRGFKVDYSFRDAQSQSLNWSFNNSNFYTPNKKFYYPSLGYARPFYVRDGGRGHKIKLAYAISHNFAANMTYFASETYGGESSDLFQIDLKARF